MDKNYAIVLCVGLVAWAIWMQGWPKLITIKKITKNVYLKSDKDTTEDE